MDFEINYDGYEDEYELNYKEIAATTRLAPVVRMLAIDLQEQPYMSPGDWFQKLSDRSLKEVMDIINDDSEEGLSEQLLLTMMLARAEGIVTTAVEDIGHQVGVLRMLVAGVGLARKGMVKMYYENMSFGEDMQDKILMDKI
jgi:hypothetical protein